MSGFLGGVAIFWGCLAFTGSIVHCVKDNWQKSFAAELVAVAWFILAALLLK